MPVYCESFQVNEGESSLQVHVFDYVNASAKDDATPTKTHKQLIALLPCIFVGSKNMATMGNSPQKTSLKKGKIFEGYFIRTKNGTYDYGYKIWTDRYLPFPPPNYPVPKEDELNDVIVIDKNNEFCGLACGPHLAFCKVATLEEVTGLNLADIRYPKGGIKAKLKRVNDDRPIEIPYAAFEAIPVKEQDPEKIPVPATKEGHENIPLPATKECNEKIPVSATKECNEKIPVSATKECNEKIPVSAAKEGHEKIPVSAAREGHEKIPVSATKEGHEKILVSDAKEGHEKIPVSAAKEGNEKIPVSAAKEGNEKIPVSAAKEGHVKIPLPGTKEGHAKIPLPGTKEGHAKIPLPGTKEGHAKIPLPGTNEGPEKIPVATLPNESLEKIPVATLPNEGLENIPLAVPKNGELEISVVVSEDSPEKILDAIPEKNSFA